MEDGSYQITGKEVVPCPNCCGELCYRDRRKRKVRTISGDTLIYLLRRMRCLSCKKYHTELPEDLIPYKRYERATFEAVLAGTEDQETVIGPGTCQKMRSWLAVFYKLFERLLSEIERETELPDGAQVPFGTAAKIIVNRGSWFVHPFGDDVSKVPP